MPTARAMTNASLGQSGVGPQQILPVRTVIRHVRHHRQCQSGQFIGRHTRSQRGLPLVRPVSNIPAEWTEKIRCRAKGPTEYTRKRITELTWNCPFISLIEKQTFTELPLLKFISMAAPSPASPETLFFHLDQTLRVCHQLGPRNDLLPCTALP